MEIEAKEEMIAPVTLELAEVEVVMEILDQVEADQVKVQVISQMLEISLNLVENVVENLNQTPVVLAVEEEGIKYIL
jgi:transcriptional regulator